MGKFTYTEAQAIQQIVLAKGGIISRPDLVNLLRARTGAMMPWWLKMYLQQLVSSGLFEMSEDGKTFKALEA